MKFEWCVSASANKPLLLPRALCSFSNQPCSSEQHQVMTGTHISCMPWEFRRHPQEGGDAFRSEIGRISKEEGNNIFLTSQSSVLGTLTMLVCQKELTLKQNGCGMIWAAGLHRFGPALSSCSYYSKNYFIAKMGSYTD